MFCIKIFKAEKINCLGNAGWMAMLGLLMRLLPVNAVENKILLVSLNIQLGILSAAVFRLNNKVIETVLF